MNHPRQPEMSKRIAVVGSFCLLMATASAQDQVKGVDSVSNRNDSGAASIRKEGRAPDLVNVTVLDFFTTVHAIQYENVMESNQVAQLNAYYNWSVNNLARTGKLSIRTFIFNEYGFRHYFDSLTVKTEDNLRIRNNLQLTPGKLFMIQCGIDQRTQLWKKWAHREDTLNGSRRYLYSDYGSPGYTMYSLGMGVNFAQGPAIYLGLVGGKITRIRNQKVFDERGASTLYGLKKGERRKVEWGMNLLVSVPPYRISKHFGWELSGTVFAPRTGIGRMRSYTAEGSNVLHYMFLRHMRLSWRTQVQYDEAIQTKIFVANHLSLGFYLSNKL